MYRLFILTLLVFMTSCYINEEKSATTRELSNLPDSLRLVSAIAPPKGYKRIDLDKSSFGYWLRNISLKKDNHVYLYNGSLKRNQTAQFAVLNISVGDKDLQQCADALMRLRAEYLFSQRRFSEIVFKDNDGKAYQWTGGSARDGFEKYLEKVFAMCGTASLEKQLKPVDSIKEVEPGDVLIRGGFPGHAMIVIDEAVNSKGEKVFMLAQSYMPAQDIHIVRNPANDQLSPWYEVNDDKEIMTPEWIFYNNQLRRW